MSVRTWAERLLNVPVAPDVVDLHVKDVVAAFLTGLRTNDGQAIARNIKEGIDRGELAAAVSAITRLSECDDIHLWSCVTPGAVVIPVALALAGDHSEDEIIRAISVGYAAGIGLGAAVGGPRALSRGVWPTLLAAPIMAAATALCLRGGDPEQLAHVIALALPLSDGRVANPAMRWTLLADAVSRGIGAAAHRDRGEPGGLNIIDTVDIAAFESAASITTVGFKPFPIARQGANAVVALQRLLAQVIDPAHINAIEVFVPAGNVALLSRAPADRLSRLCNMGLQLAGAALSPELLYDPERVAQADVLDFARRVTVTAASDLESQWPERWPARVVVHAGGEGFEETVIQAPFDHDAAGLAPLLQEKWRRMLSPENLILLNLGQLESAPYATLWQQIERRLRVPAED